MHSMACMRGTLSTYNMSTVAHHPCLHCTQCLCRRGADAEHSKVAHFTTCLHPMYASGCRQSLPAKRCAQQLQPRGQACVCICTARLQGGNMVPEALPMMGVAQRQGAASDTAYDSSAVSILEQAMALGVVPSFRSGHHQLQ